MTLSLDKMGRLVVPKALRDRFALKPGDQLDATLEPDGIRLRVIAPAHPWTVQSGILVCSSELPASAWDLGGFIDLQRDQRSRELGGL
ncbi:MAG: AbrB/MazE/SpoVT family DNA-binding domain-containing protein [Prosthecobacter sp.]|nr:AbrB/MazE/SpoVT family DNA-binding domain-containing protein [Prosthecobacter sp.]